MQVIYPNVKNRLHSHRNTEMSARNCDYRSRCWIGGKEARRSENMWNDLGTINRIGFYCTMFTIFIFIGLDGIRTSVSYWKHLGVCCAAILIDQNNCATISKFIWVKSIRFTAHRTLVIAKIYLFWMGAACVAAILCAAHTTTFMGPLLTFHDFIRVFC